MSFKIGKRTCPDSVEGILKEKGVFMAGFIEHLEKTHCAENIEFILAYDQKKKSKYLYEKFIDKKLRKKINIRAEYADAMKRLADATDWTSREWKTNLDQAYNECTRNLDSQEGPYLRSKSFGQALWATVQSNINYVDGKVINGVGMLNNRAFINDKHMTKCVQMTKLAGVLKTKRNVTANDAKRTAEAMFKRQLKAKYALETDYVGWQKLVDKHM